MITVRVYGDKETAAAFKSMGLKVRDLHAAWDRIGAAIKGDAVPLDSRPLGRPGPVDQAGPHEVIGYGPGAGGARVPYAGTLN